MDYLNDVKIDESALDVEWLNQPRLVFIYSEYQAKMMKRLTKAKERLDFVRAELDREIRTDPEKYEIIKVTEGAVQAVILTQEGFIDANQEVLDADYEFNIAQAAVRALQDKKSALENLVRLHGQQYFAGPSVPRDLSKEWIAKEEQKTVNNKISAGMRRKS